MGAQAFSIKKGMCCGTCNGLIISGQGDACLGGTQNHATNVTNGGGGICDGAVPGYQDNWRQCKNCGNLFFHGNSTNGTCFKSGTHDLGTSPNYSIQMRSTPTPTSEPNYQGTFYVSWRWCHKCECLFYGGNAGGKMGSCPKGSQHDASKSGYYSLLFG